MESQLIALSKDKNDKNSVSLLDIEMKFCVVVAVIPNMYCNI